MRSLVVIGLVLVPLPARATPSCSSIPECLARVQLPRLDAVTLAKVGAVVAPVVLGVGAFVTIAAEQNQPKPEPAGVVVVPDETGQPRPSLELVPTARDPYYNPDPPPPERPPASGAMRFNDTAANVALAVGGAAVIGGIIAGIVQGAKHH